MSTSYINQQFVTTRVEREMKERLTDAFLINTCQLLLFFCNSLKCQVALDRMEQPREMGLDELQNLFSDFEMNFVIIGFLIDKMSGGLV